jgi:hypothetical protein
MEAQLRVMCLLKNKLITGVRWEMIVRVHLLCIGGVAGVNWWILKLAIHNVAKSFIAMALCPLLTIPHENNERIVPEPKRTTLSVCFLLPSKR